MRKILFRNSTFNSFITILVFNLLMNGCHSYKVMSVEDRDSLKIYGVETRSGEIIEFENNKYSEILISDSTIVNIKSDGKRITVNKSDIENYLTKKFDAIKTIGLIAGIAATMSIIAIVLLVIRLNGSGVGR